MPIREQLENRTAAERANLKGQEIARVAQKRSHVRGNLRIEIVDLNAIEGGVEVFARVWRNGQQLGFGMDGSVDIERFRIFNPPVLVPDPAGDIVQEWEDNEGKVQSRRLREDLQEALLQVVEHNLSVMKNVHTAERVVKGKIGRTTSTFYPAAGASTPIDGWYEYGLANPGTVWATLRAATATVSNGTATAEKINTLTAATTAGQWRQRGRGIFGFDTSAIGADVVSSATLSLYGSAVASGYSQSMVIDKMVPASSSAVANSDDATSRWDGVEQATNRISWSVWSTSGYNDFTLNATGIGNVNTSGLSWFGTRASGEFDNIQPTYSNSGQKSASAYFADQTGTTNDPKLVVEHAAGGTTYTLTADTVAFSLTGQAAALKRIYRMAATVGTFVLTGIAANLRRTLNLAAAPASFTLTGNPAALRRIYRLTAETGVFTLTGNDVAFDVVSTAVLTAETGVFTLTGNEANLRRITKLSADPASFSLTGSDATLKRIYRMQAETGVFTLTGNDVTFYFPQIFTLTAETGHITLSGIPVAFQSANYPDPDWIYEAVPGGTWLAGQFGMTAGALMFDGFTAYAGQLGEISTWDVEIQLDDELTEEPFWTYEVAPGGTWFAGQPSLTAGALMFDGLQVYAGQLGEASSWEHEVQ